MKALIPFMFILCFLCGVEATTFAQRGYSDFGSDERTSVFFDDFEDNKNDWTISETSDYTFSVKSGAYKLENYANEAYRAAGLLKIDESKDFEIEVRCRAISGKNIGWYGLTWNYSNNASNTNENSWRFELSKNGQFSLDVVQNNNVKSLITWQASKAIGDTNIVIIRKVADMYFFFINQKLVAEQKAEKPFLGDHIGFLIKNMVVEVDYIGVNYLQNTCRPIIEKDALFASDILSREGKSSDGGVDDTNGYVYIGDKYGEVGLKMTNLYEKGTRFKLVISNPDGFFAPSTLMGRLQDKYSMHEFFPVMLWDKTKLFNLRQERTTSINYKLYINDKLAEDITSNTSVRPINDCPYVTVSRRSLSKEPSFLPYIYTAYANEHNRRIKSTIIPTILKNNPDLYKSSNPEKAFEVWLYLRNSGINYNNIKNAYNTKNTSVQHVRGINDIIFAKQANCIEGVNEFASIMYNLQMSPYYALVPGHAYISYPVDESSEKPSFQFLETTTLQKTYSDAELKAVEKQLDAKDLKAIKAQYKGERYKLFLSFLSNINETTQSFINDKSKFESEEKGYTIFSLQTAREAGYKPLFDEKD
jgi:hypothetical protein